MPRKCCVCFRRLTNHKKAIFCSSCQGLCHRKCSFLKTQDIIALNLDSKYLWDCQNCVKDMFPFASLSANEIIAMGFNSLMVCACRDRLLHYTLDDSSREFYKFKFSVNTDENDNLGDKFYVLLENNNELDFMEMNTNFNYYDTHDFHKLSRNNHTGNLFSLFHSNICSLNGNFEKLENLLNDLEFQFSIIALSETWTTKENLHLFEPGELQGYWPYTGSLGNSMKGGCGFYIANNINYLERFDLDCSIADGNNEFQSKWIEIINENKKIL